MLIHLSELLIHQSNLVIYLIRNRFLSQLISLYENYGIQACYSVIYNNDIDFVVLLKIFWLTKILVLPLGIRPLYTNPFLTIKNA